MVRLAPEIRDAAQRYVRVRLSNLRGLDLNVFDFDYDLTWVALLFTPEGNILGRFGGREADSRDRYLTLAAFRHALDEGLISFKTTESRVLERKPRRPENYAAARGLGPSSCIHCHHVHEFQRVEAMEKRSWRPAHEFRFPDPRTLGITLDPAQGNRVREATGKTPLKKGDVLLSIDGSPVRSYADITYRLHRAPQSGELVTKVLRNGAIETFRLPLTASWKERTDFSWRWSIKAIQPEPPVQGEDLGSEERKALGIPEGVLALRQGPFLSQAARHAGIQIGDIILGVDAAWSAENARQFDAYFRIFERDRAKATFTLLRGKERLQVQVPVR